MVPEDLPQTTRSKPVAGAEIPPPAAHWPPRRRPCGLPSPALRGQDVEGWQRNSWSAPGWFPCKARDDTGQCAVATTASVERFATSGLLSKRRLPIAAPLSI